MRNNKQWNLFSDKQGEKIQFCNHFVASLVFYIRSIFCIYGDEKFCSWSREIYRYTRGDTIYSFVPDLYLKCWVDDVYNINFLLFLYNP